MIIDKIRGVLMEFEEEKQEVKKVDDLPKENYDKAKELIQKSKSFDSLVDRIKTERQAISNLIRCCNASFDKIIEKNAEIKILNEKIERLDKQASDFEVFKSNEQLDSALDEMR